MPRNFSYKTELGSKMGKLSKRVDRYIRDFDKNIFIDKEDAEEKIREFEMINKMVDKMEAVVENAIEEIKNG